MRMRNIVINTIYIMSCNVSIIYADVQIYTLYLYCRILERPSKLIILLFYQTNNQNTNYLKCKYVCSVNVGECVDYNHTIW